MHLWDCPDAESEWPKVSGRVEAGSSWDEHPPATCMMVGQAFVNWTLVVLLRLTFLVLRDSLGHEGMRAEGQAALCLGDVRPRMKWVLRSI